MLGRSDFRLPPLTGWVLSAYRALMVALLLIALPGLLYAYENQRDAQGSVDSAFAAGLRFPGGNGAVIRVAPLSDEARNKGVLPGDELVAVNAQSFDPGDFGRLQDMLSGPDRSHFSLTIRTGEQHPRTIVLTRDAHYLERAYAGSGLTFASRSWTVFVFRMLDATLAMVTALLLFVRRSNDPVAAMLAICSVPLSDGLTYLWPDSGFALFSFYLLRTMLFLVALLTFPDGRFVPRWTFWTTPLIPLIAMVSIQAITVEYAVTLRAVLLFGFIGIAIGALILRYRKTSPGIQRQQIKFVMLGGVVWACLGLVAMGLARLADISLSVPAAAWLSLLSHLASSLAAIALEAGILVSLLRYRLYDADMLIGRSAGYAFLTLLLGAVFSGTEKMVQVMGQQFFGEGARVISAGFGAAIAATSIAPLNKRIHRWAENRFQRQLAALKSDLPTVVGDLREVATLDTLLAAVLDRIERGIRTSHTAAILRNGEGEEIVRSSDISESDVRDWRRGMHPVHRKGLDCDRSDTVFPVRVPLRADGAGLIGWILIGPRPDGSFYGKDEREALASVADPIARAIQIVRERDAHNAEQRAAHQTLEQRIGVLEQRIEAVLSARLGST